MFQSCGSTMSYLCPTSSDDEGMVQKGNDVEGMQANSAKRGASDLDTSDNEEPPGKVLKRPSTARRRVSKKPSSATTDADKDIPQQGQVKTNLPMSLLIDDVAKWALEEVKSLGALDSIVQAVRGCEGQVVRVGSLCSGLGTDIMACHALQRAWGALGTSVSLTFKHEMTCEISPYKRGHLKQTFPESGPIFDDVKKLGRQTAHDYREDIKATTIPSNLDILLAGFSCKSLSSLNVSKSDIRDRGSTTGATLDGVLKYVKAHHPKVLILENVRGIAQRVGGGDTSMMAVLKKLLHRHTYMYMYM
jgi:hypothetical protein